MEPARDLVRGSCRSLFLVGARGVCDRSPFGSVTDLLVSRAHPRRALLWQRGVLPGLLATLQAMSKMGPPMTWLRLAWKRWKERARWDEMGRARLAR